MTAPSSQSLWIACGTAGSFVDVSTYVSLLDPVSRTWGRKSQFEDVRPGTFSFTLDNADGRFTPGNSASALAVPLKEGMRVCWELAGRLVAGVISAFDISFAGDVADYPLVRVTCVDALGEAARLQMSGSLADDMVFAASPYLYWPMSDSGGITATEQSGNGQPAMSPRSYDAIPVATFGYPGLSGSATTQAFFTGDGTSVSGYALSAGTDNFQTINYPSSTSMGSWGFWLTPNVPTNESLLAWFWMQIRYQATLIQIYTGDPGVDSLLTGRAGNGATVNLLTLQSGVTRYIGIDVTNTSTTVTATFYVDGVAVGSSTGTGLTVNSATKTIRSVDLEHQDDSSGSTSFYLYGLSHTPSRVPGEKAVVATETGRAVAIAAAVPSLALVTPTGLSSAPIGLNNPSSGSALSALNDVVKTEQGHLYATTTGTTSSPNQQVTLRGRDRPTNVSLSLSVSGDILGAPTIERSTSDTYARVNVRGPSASADVSDGSIVPLVGNTSTSESVLLANARDLRLWGEDRLIRGVDETVRIVDVTVDAQGTDSDRWADLLAVKPGDRHRITGLPSAQLGFGTWDGWLLGANESHTGDRSSFTFYYQPVRPDSAIYDTDRYMSDGAITLNAGINSSVTSIVYATTSPEMATTGSVPYTILIDSEQITVTAVNQGTNTMTVTRGVNGTTAASHSSGAAIELSSSSLYAF